MTTVNEPRAEARTARCQRWPGPPAKLMVWLFSALAALVLVVTIVMTVQSGAAPCTSTAPGQAAQYHAQIQICAPAGRNPVAGRR
jgi:hypothetical protein